MRHSRRPASSGATSRHEPRHSRRAFVFLAVAGLAFALTLADARGCDRGHDTTLEPSARRARELGLTDLCLFTDARYARHPSQADWHGAFQDHPLALEHFPSGSLLLPTALERPGTGEAMRLVGAER